MLTIIVPETEYYNDENNTFIPLPAIKVTLEHSLLSLSKWESKFKKPFLSTDDKSREEVLKYIEYMIISPAGNLHIVSRMSQENLDAINEYIESPESATTFGEMPQRKGRGELITSELIYYWMVAFNIPFEVESWHLNRLFSLIRICNIKNQKPKKMSRSEIARQNRDVNARRRAELNTTG